jgi:Kef-type K+ transport system membrane component KefB
VELHHLYPLSTFLGDLHPLGYIGILLLCGYAGGKVASYVKAPRVSGYLVVGMLLSPSLLGVFDEQLVKEELTLVTDMALSIIAFSIGGSLAVRKLRRLEAQIVWITPLQALMASFLTTVLIASVFPLIGGQGLNSSSFMEVYFPMALVIGAISAATAPAATLAIIHEYKAKGPLTTILLGVVALDDGLTIFLFAFAMSVAQALTAHESLSLQTIVLSPAAHILIALGLGAAMGVCMRLLIPFVPRREGMLGVVLGSVFLTSGLAISLDASSLLANMMLGFMVVNYVRQSHHLFTVVENIEEPIFAMFFTVAGAHLDLRVIQSAGWLALLIVLGRFTGKLVGSRIGAQISGAPDAIKKYLGVGLLPAAGVTVGLVLLARDIFGRSHISEVMVSAVLGSVIINELLAPILVRHALVKSGEAGRT